MRDARKRKGQEWEISPGGRGLTFGALLLALIFPGVVRAIATPPTPWKLVQQVLAIVALTAIFWWMAVGEVVRGRLWRRLRSWYEFFLIASVVLAIMGLSAGLRSSCEVDPCGDCVATARRFDLRLWLGLVLAPLGMSALLWFIDRNILLRHRD